LSDPRNALVMNELFPIDELVREIARYLAAVDVFRAESCEPTWQPEVTNAHSALAERLAAYAPPTPQPAH
jgi:hypothetical protein